MRIPSRANIFKKSIFSLRVGSTTSQAAEWEWRGTGSAVYADEKRTLILTAAHVVSPKLAITAKSAEGREFIPLLMPNHDRIADLALLEARTSDIGEVITPFPIATGFGLLQTNYTAIGFSAPDILEAINIRGIGMSLRRSCGRNFFYLCGDVDPGYSGGPLFEAGQTDMLGIIAGKLHSMVLYGPSYETIRNFVSAAAENSGQK